jgi:hypothetical protein
MMRGVRHRLGAVIVLLVAAEGAVGSSAALGQPRLMSAASERDNAVIQWNAALLEAVRRAKFAPVLTARALAITHTCMYDAWAAYDAQALGTRFWDALRRPVGDRTETNKRIAVSHAAYRALVDLFPADRETLFDPLMRRLGLDPTASSTTLATPDSVGYVACSAVVAWRRGDGANQTGEINRGLPYSDYTGYKPFNPPDRVLDPNRWQPLRAANGTVQRFQAPHWALVTPFALRSPAQFRPQPPVRSPDPSFIEQVDEVVRLSGALTDREKAIAEYWADGPASSTPPGHWNLFAQFVSRRDHHTLDDDVKMFFVLGNAMLDASIVVWDCKVLTDYVRPVTAIRMVYAGRTIDAWAGPRLGVRRIRGEQFQSYIPTPPFSEYTSGHSAFSAAGAEILELVSGGQTFGASDTVLAGSSLVEPVTTPSANVTLSWPTFDAAAREAGYSRLLGGIHFRDANVRSYEMGRKVAREVWQKAQALISGRMS